MNRLSEADDRDDGGATDAPLLFFRSLRRSLPWVILLVLLGASVGIAVGLLQPNRYVSSAKLLLRVGAREQLTSESLVDLDERQPAPPTMVDEVQMLSDVSILERVAAEIGPDVVLEVADPARDDGPLTPAPIRLMHATQARIFRISEHGCEGSEKELRAATKVLRDDTTIAHEPGSSVIVVSHTSTSPERARTIVQALVSAFIERHREQFSIQTLLDKSRSELEGARRARDEAARAYVEHVSQSGIAELESQVPRLDAEISLLENDLFDARVRREEIARLRDALSSRLQGIPAEVEITRPSVMIPNEEYETQLTLKRMLLAQKQEMLIQNRPSEELRRREKEFDRQIAKVEEKLRGTPKVIVQGSEMQENLGHAAMETRIADLEVEDEALSVKTDLVDTRLNARRTRMAELQKELLTATMLRKDLASNRDAEETRYAHLLDRFSALEALDSIDVNEEANLRVLQAPTLEYEKVGPKRFSMLIKGSLAGALAAIAFAILRQRFERRLHYPESFEHARGVPVLGVVPELSSMRRLRRRALVGTR